jgi:hypothetical protein
MTTGCSRKHCNIRQRRNRTLERNCIKPITKHYVACRPVARQRLGKIITVVMNAHAKVEDLLVVSFSMRSVSYQGKHTIFLFPEFLLLLLEYECCYFYLIHFVYCENALYKQAPSKLNKPQRMPLRIPKGVHPFQYFYCIVCSFFALFL